VGFSCLIWLHANYQTRYNIHIFCNGIQSIFLFTSFSYPSNMLLPSMSSHAIHALWSERGDRIMGAVNYYETGRLREREIGSKNKVVCMEIHRSLNTPENKLLLLILYAIMMYCSNHVVANTLSFRMSSSSKMNSFYSFWPEYFIYFPSSCNILIPCLQLIGINPCSVK
jgi:hypothetical protein